MGKLAVMKLKDDDILTKRVQSRRKFLARAGGAVVGAIGGATASESQAVDFDNKDHTRVDNDGKDGSHIDGDGRDRPK
jgi:hypothetical protein